MTKRHIVGIAAVYVVWALMDFILHGMILEPIYGATAELWRPMEEMNMGLMQLVTLVTAACFVLIYVMIGSGSIGSGIKYGALFGIAAGFPMGFGSYSYMPIPMTLAVGWFVGTTIEGIVAGAVAGKLLATNTAE